MSAPSEIRELVAEIRTTGSTLERVHDDLQAAPRDDITALGRTGRSALIPAGLLENYYTCLETSMLRVSQHLDNNLDPSDVPTTWSRCSPRSIRRYSTV